MFLIITLLALRVTLLPPATKLRQGNVFSHVSHSVHREGVCLWARGYLLHTPGQTHLPGTDTPQADTPWQTHLWVDTPQADTPWADIPLGRHSPGRHPSGQTSPWADTPPGRHPPAQCMLGYGQQAGGMLPTGMNSCWFIGLKPIFANKI